MRTLAHTHQKPQTNTNDQARTFVWCCAMCENIQGFIVFRVAKWNDTMKQLFCAKTKQDEYIDGN